MYSMLQLFWPPHCLKLNQARNSLCGGCWRWALRSSVGVHHGTAPSDLEWGSLRRRGLGGGFAGREKCNHWFCNKQPQGIRTTVNTAEAGFGTEPGFGVQFSHGSSRSYPEGIPPPSQAHSSGLYWRTLVTSPSAVFPSWRISIIGCCSWWGAREGWGKNKDGVITGGTCSTERSTAVMMRGRRIGAGVLHCWENNTVWL